MIIAEYGYTKNNEQVYGSSLSSTPYIGEPKGEKQSHFDITLNEIYNKDISLSSQTEEAINKDSSLETPSKNLGADDPLSDNTRKEIIEKNASQDTIKKVTPEEKNIITEKPLKLNLHDIKYISEINRQINTLISKLKGKKSSENDLKEIATEFNKIVQGFQQFIDVFNKQNKGRIDTSQFNMYNQSAPSTLINQNNHSSTDKLLLGIFSKLQDLKESLSQMGMLPSTGVRSLKTISENIDLGVKDLEKMNSELDKTLLAFKELKEVSKNINENDKIGQITVSKFDSPILSSEVFTKENIALKNISPTHKNTSSLYINSASVDATPNVAGGSSVSWSSGDHSSSSFTSDNSSSFHMGGGLLKSSFLNNDGSLKDPSQMNLQDKMNLGREVLNQLQTEIKGYIGKKESHFSIVLKPEELGEVKVIMEMKEGTIKTQIVVENEIIKDLLKNRFDAMKNIFQENGINISEMNVHTQSEYQDNSENRTKNNEAIFNTYKQAATEVKLGRLENNQKIHFTYDKTADNMELKEKFIITV